MKLFIVLALVAVALGEPPVNYGAPSRLSTSYSSPSRVSYSAPSYSAPSYSAPSQSYGSPARISTTYSSPSSSYGTPARLISTTTSTSYGAPSSGGYSSGGYRQSRGGPYVSDPDLHLENEGHNIPNEIIDQELLNKVVDALSQDLASQNAYRAASSQAYGVPNSGYGAPSSGGYSSSSGGYNSGSNGRITLLIPPDPLKAKLIANYIQSPIGSSSAFGRGGSSGYN